MTHHLLGAVAGGPTAYRDSGMAGSAAPRTRGPGPAPTSPTPPRRCGRCSTPCAPTSWSPTTPPVATATPTTCAPTRPPAAPSPRRPTHRCCTPCYAPVVGRRGPRLAGRARADRPRAGRAGEATPSPPVVPDAVVTHTVVDPSVVAGAVAGPALPRDAGRGGRRLVCLVQPRRVPPRRPGGLRPARRGDRPTDDRGSTVSDDPLDPARFRQAMGRLVAGRHRAHDLRRRPRPRDDRRHPHLGLARPAARAGLRRERDPVARRRADRRCVRGQRPRRRPAPAVGVVRHPGSPAARPARPVPPPPRTRAPASRCSTAP